jgi:hypothetical protein
MTSNLWLRSSSRHRAALIAILVALAGAIARGRCAHLSL